MSKKSTRSVTATPATKHLDKLGVTYTLHAYEFDPGDLGIGEQAAKALGIETARIFKTLMVMADGKTFVVALVPVHAETQMKLLAATIGSKRAAMATIPDAERVTGYVKGGISPFGQRQRHQIVVNQTALDYETIFVNGGKRGLQIEIAPVDLIRELDAKLADISR